MSTQQDVAEGRVRSGALRLHLLCLVAPLAILTGALVVALSWAPELPDPVATHFGASGRTDGFGSLTGLLVVILGLGVALAVLGWYVAARGGRVAAARRQGIALALGIAAFMATTVLVTLAPQRGLADATELHGLGLGFVWPFVAGVAAAALGVLATPADGPSPATVPVAADAPRIPLAADERATWVQAVRSPTILALMAVGVVVAGYLVVVLRQPLTALVPVVLVVLLGTSAGITVTIDARGLTVRSVWGWPRMRVPADEVLEAHAVTVSPLRSFGGWGYRIGLDGRTGIVLRGGPAIEVTSTGRRVLVVTTGDADTGARLLNTLAARTRTA
ncbi:DUF1648 domain-containing protein [Cellulomonas hominis]